MRTPVGKIFFENIRRNIKISYFIASIIPLSLLVYFSIQYVYPYLTSGDLSGIPLNIGVILFLAVIISLLGLYLSTKAVNESITSLQEFYAKLSSLSEITKQLRESLQPDTLLENIVRAAMNLTSAEAGSLLLYDDSGNLRFKVLSEKWNKSLINRAVKQNEYISAWVAETGEPVIINDVAGDKRYNSDFDAGSGFKTKSLLSVPLVHNDEVIGVIETLNKRDDGFTIEDEELLYNLAVHAALTIVQSKRYETPPSDTNDNPGFK